MLFPAILGPVISARRLLRQSSSVSFGTKYELIIKDGRHPVVEQFVSDSYFVPNDTEPVSYTHLDVYKRQMMNHIHKSCIFIIFLRD